MTQPIAPCGHPGIPIIGTYVQCALGCDGAVPPRRRGEPGHVEMCACRPCQIRRRVVVIELRSRDGKSIRRLPWDGITDTIGFNAAERAEVRHILWLDSDGVVIVRQDSGHTIHEGDRVDLTLFPDRAAADAMLLRVWGESPLAGWASARRAWKQDLSRKLGNVAGEIERVQTRIAAAAGIPLTYLLGINPGYAAPADMVHFYGAVTRAQVAAMAQTVFGVDEVEVSSPRPGHILVRITAGADDLNYETVREVHKRVDRVRAAGTSLEVRLDTPQQKLRRAMTSVRSDLALGRVAWSHVFEAMQRAVAEEFGAGVAGSVETSISGGGTDPAWKLGVGIEAAGMHYEGRVRVDLVDTPRVGTWLTGAKAGEMATLTLKP